MNKILLVVTGVLITFCSLCAMPAPKPKARIIAPDTVIQCRPFNVVYQIESRQRPEIPAVADCRASKREGKVTVKGNVRTWTYEVTMETWGSGHLTITCPGAETVCVAVKEHDVYGKELTAARDFLARRGLADSLVQLQRLASLDGLHLFNDPYKGYFVAVADRRYAGLLDCPVMAYGMRGSYYGTKWKAGKTQHKLFKYYITVLDALKSSGRTWSEAMVAAGRTAEVKPMLGGTCWAQSEPYNIKSAVIVETGERAPVGCVPLAAAQVMRYYGYPERGEGKYVYRLPEQKEKEDYEFDFSRLSIDWKALADTYTESQTTEVEGLSRLLEYLGAGSDAKFRAEVTTVELRKIKRTLQTHLDYSPGIYIAQSDNAADMVRLVYGELDAGRPCIVSDYGHAFVCDGNDGDFAHFNLGWGGHFSGYYRFDALAVDTATVMPLKRVVMPITSAVVRIEPRKDMSRKVTLERAGTLSSLLTREEKENATRLKVTGPLNSADIRLLRLMAGAGSDGCDGADSTVHGSLRVLDLSDAVLKFDNRPYLRTSAAGRQLSGTQTRYTNDEIMGLNRTASSYRYSFDRMTPELWKELQSKGFTEYYDTRYIEEDGKYYVCYFMRKNEVGRSMFIDCVNLHTVVLPMNTKAIGSNAFSRCMGLSVITLPKTVRRVGRYAFAYTPSLHGVGTLGKFDMDGTMEDMFKGNAGTTMKFYKVPR